MPICHDGGASVAFAVTRLPRPSLELILIAALLRGRLPQAFSCCFSPLEDFCVSLL